MPGFTSLLLALAVAGSPRAGSAAGREPVPRYWWSQCARPCNALRGLEIPWPAVSAALLADGGLLHVEQELRVALGLLHPLHQDLERLLRLQRVQHPAELPDDLQLLGGHQDLLLAGAGGIHVDRGEDPLVGQLTAQPQLHVAGALELLEDDLVRAGSGL